VHNHDSFTIKVDGTGRLTRRNRRFLRRFVPASLEVRGPPASPLPESRDQPYSGAEVLMPGVPHQSSENQCASPLVFSERPGGSAVDQPSSDCEPTTATMPLLITPAAATPASNIAPPKSDSPTTSMNPGTAPDTETVIRPRRERRPPLKYVPETGEWK
jgi:hypothetical protein